MGASRGFNFLGGTTAILTGLLLFIAHLVNFLAGSAEGTVLGQSIVFIAHVIAVFAFIGIYDAQGRKKGILGLVGMILSTVGTIIVSAIVYVEIASASGVNVRPVFHAAVPSLILLVGPLMFVVGLLCLGISTILVKVLPRWGGFLLIVGDIVFALGSVAGNAEPLISTLGAAITGGGFVWVGISLIRMKQKDDISYNVGKGI